MGNKISIYTTTIGFSMILILIIIFPNTSYQAAKNGVDIWFNNVFPALLPFFIGTELLMGLGVVHFLGVLLEPIMYPFFKVPGTGSFVYVMSITSGYPMGAKLTSDLRSRKICSRIEGQRLLALCSTSGPLFIIGTVAIGMFNKPFLGGVIAISHYIGSFLLGLVFRYYGSDKKIEHSKERKFNPLQALYQGRLEDGRNLGVLMGDSVKNSINTLLVIGGFIIFFSVLIELFDVIMIFDLFSLLISPISYNLNLSPELIKGLSSGLLEITNGIDIISKTNDSLLIQVVATSFIIAWGGFSIHAQAINFIGKTDLKVSPYIIAKIFHGLFASVSCFVLIKIFLPYSHALSVPTFLSYNTTLLKELTWINRFIFSTEFYISMLLFLLVMGIFTQFFSWINLYRHK